jgi:rod shape-determining protein MreD
VWFISLFFVVTKGSVTSHGMTLYLFEPDLVTILVAYLLVSYRETGAGIFAFCQGFLVDIFTAGPLGLFSLLYLAVFLGIHLVGSRFFDLHSPRGQFVIISLAVLLKEVLFGVFLYVSSLEIVFSVSFLCAVISSAMVSGLVGPLFFYLLNRVRRSLNHGARRTSDEWV